MMAVTNHSSLNKSEIDFLEENLENCSVENQYFLGYFDWKRDEFEALAVEVHLLLSVWIWHLGLVKPNSGDVVKI